MLLGAALRALVLCALLAIGGLSAPAPAGNDAGAPFDDGFLRHALRDNAAEIEGLLDAAFDPATFRRKYFRSWAWTWSYGARASLLGYGLYGDAAFLDPVIDGALHYARLGEAHAELAGYGWYTWERKTGRWFREITTAGLVATPILDLLLLARRDARVRERIADVAPLLETAARNGLDGFDHLYRRHDGAGYFVTPLDTARPEALNHMAMYAVALARLHQLTGDPAVHARIAEMARFWKRAATKQANGSLAWPYEAMPGAMTGPAEAFWKASITIELPLAAFEAGAGVTQEDLAAVAGTLGNVIALSDPQAVPVANIDGTGEPREDKADIASLAMWNLLGCLDPPTAADLTRRLYDMDAAFVQRSARALYAVVYGAHISAAPQACARYAATP